MSKYYIVDLDDWKVLYIDGKKVMEGHSFYDEDLLRACGVDIEVEFVENDTPISEYAERFGTLPDTLEKLDKVGKNEN